MAITTFIPQIWSARLLNALEKAHVAAQLVNTDYEGEIKQHGDTVKINSLGAITIKDYTKNTDMDAPETLTTEEAVLTISQAKYFNFQVDDIDKVQANAELIDKAMKNAAYGLADVADAYLFTTMAAGADTKHKLTSTKLTAENIYAKIVEMRTVMDKANVPTSDRSLTIPPEAYALLLQDTRFVAGGGDRAEKTVRNGEVGNVAGFTVFTSNNLPVAADSGKAVSLIASIKSATTYAEQIIKTDAYKLEKRFADGVKGLHVYGAKVIEKKGIVVLPATF
nr:MAG TPA: Major capsid protein [Caudoviricetes sp.]